MTKKDLVMAVCAANPSTSRQLIEDATHLVFEMMTFYLNHHQRVELRGFGIFSVRTRAGHKAHNPQTGETLWIPEKSVPFFRPSSALKNALKKNVSPVKTRTFFAALKKAVTGMI